MELVNPWHHGLPGSPCRALPLPDCTSRVCAWTSHDLCRDTEYHLPLAAPSSIRWSTHQRWCNIDNSYVFVLGIRLMDHCLSIEIFLGDFGVDGTLEAGNRKESRLNDFLSTTVWSPLHLAINDRIRHINLLRYCLTQGSNCRTPRAMLDHLKMHRL